MIHHYCDATDDDSKTFHVYQDQTSDQSLGLYLELIYNLCGGVMTASTCFTMVNSTKTVAH